MTADGVNDEGRGCNSLLSLLRALAWICAALLFAGCGGGNSGSQRSEPSASLIYPSSSLMFVAGTQIAPVVPTASQVLTSFTVAPALPSGLSLNPSTGDTVRHSHDGFGCCHVYRHGIGR